MAEFSTAYPAPYSFALGQCSCFTDDPAEVKGLSLEAKAGGRGEAKLTKSAETAVVMSA